MSRRGHVLYKHGSDGLPDLCLDFLEENGVHTAVEACEYHAMKKRFLVFSRRLS